MAVRESPQHLGLVELGGSNYEIGLGHGAFFKKEVASIVQSLLAEAQARTGMSKDSICSVVLRYMPLLQANAPHLIDEIRGIAEGAGVPFQLALLLNHRHEFMYGIRSRSQLSADECTILGVTAERSATKSVVMAQNVDLPPSFLGKMALFKLKPRKGPSIMMCALVGTVGHHGMNSYGLARCSSAIVTSHEKALGLSRVVISRMILEKKSVEDAVDTIATTERAVSGNYMLADKSDKLLDIETTAKEWRLISPKKGFIAHTNHVVHSELMPFGQAAWADSLPRYERIRRLALERKGTIAPDIVCRWLRDHHGHPASICNHSDHVTVASVLFQPREGTMLACAGPPCQNQYALHSF
jgi:isopenicillin-N N-acyltransferase-like protein